MGIKILTLRKTVTTTYDLVEIEVDSFTLTKEVGEQIKSIVVIEKDVKLPKVEEVKYTIMEVLKWNTL